MNWLDVAKAGAFGAGALALIWTMRIISAELRLKQPRRTSLPLIFSAMIFGLVMFGVEAILQVTLSRPDAAIASAGGNLQAIAGLERLKLCGLARMVGDREGSNSLIEIVNQIDENLTQVAKALKVDLPYAQSPCARDTSPRN